MRIIFFIVVAFFISTTVTSQEIGSVINEQYSIKLLKTSNNYALIYSDIYSSDHNVINFQMKETVYNILVDGFKSAVNHLIILKTNNDLIVNLEFVNIKGEKMLKIAQNNLANNTTGTSTYFSKTDILKVFGQP